MALTEIELALVDEIERLGGYALAVEAPSPSTRQALDRLVSKGVLREREEGVWVLAQRTD